MYSPVNQTQRFTEPNLADYLGDSVMLDSFGNNLNVVVVGASGGLGRAFQDILLDIPSVNRVFSLSRKSEVFRSSKLENIYVDLESTETIEDAAERIQSRAGTVNLILLATGLLHDGPDFQPERSWTSLTAQSLERAFKINTIAPAVIATKFLPLLAKKKKSSFIALSARVGSIGDNRLGGWHSYRASKAALNMLIRTFSIELTRRNPEAVCACLHPGTVDTRLSKPFQRNIPQATLKGSIESAAQLIKVINNLTPNESGGFYAWDGTEIPY